MPFISNIAPGELIIILVIILVIFGPGRLPEIGQAVGKGIREFRKAATDVSEATRLDAPPAAPTPSPPPAAPTDMTPVSQPPVSQPPVSQPPAAPSTPADESHDGASQPTA